MVVLPLRNIGAYSFEIDLDSRVYNFEFKWNSRHEFWSMNIQNRQGDYLLRGVKLLPNFEILRRYRNADLPPGALVPVDVTRTIQRIGRNDLEQNIKLVYVPKDELDGIV